MPFFEDEDCEWKSKLFISSALFRLKLLSSHGSLSFRRASGPDLSSFAFTKLTKHKFNLRASTHVDDYLSAWYFYTKVFNLFDISWVQLKN